MGKRLKRLRGAELSAKTLESWKGKRIDAVLLDGTALHGVLAAFDENSVTIKDALHGLEWRDSRHLHVLKREQIEELVAQLAAPL